MDDARRGLGPFTGTHLTVIVVAMIAALVVPTGAVAAGIAKVQVANGSGAVARVTSGRLQVGAQVAGTVKTSQQGPVTMQTARPADFRHYLKTVNATLCQPIATAPANRALVVRMVRVHNFSSEGEVLVGSGCNIGAAAVYTRIGFHAMEQLPFDPGLGIPAGQSLYGFAVGTTMSFMVEAYVVPASQVTSMNIVSN